MDAHKPIKSTLTLAGETIFRLSVDSCAPLPNQIANTRTHYPLTTTTAINDTLFSLACLGYNKTININSHIVSCVIYLQYIQLE